MLVVEPRKIRIDTQAQVHLISCTYKLIVICVHSSLQIVSTGVKNRVWPAAVHLINAHAAVDPPRTDVEERNNTRHPICTVLFRYSPLAHSLAFISGPRSILQQGQKNSISDHPHPSFELSSILRFPSGSMCFFRSSSSTRHLISN